MRLIGTLDEQKGLIFSQFLRQQGIGYQLEIKTNRDWGSPDYGLNNSLIWIHDEDQVEEATKWYHFFLNNPQDPIFFKNKHALPGTIQPEFQSDSLPPSPTPKMTQQESDKNSSTEQLSGAAWTRKPMGPITRLLLLACCGVFILLQLLTPVHEVLDHVPITPFNSPVEKALLYDYPYKYELIDKFIHLYGYEALQNSTDLPKEGRYLLSKIAETPAWQGIYPIIQKKGVGTIKDYLLHTQMFEKIRQGELWRLFSPSIVHADIFHLFFNMIWLIVLGKQLELRLKAWRYILFILLTGIFSNTAQYLVGGPNFIGFSGVLCAMITFVWVRQRHSPWESYQLDQMTIFFIMLFIVSMALIQVFFFFLEKTTNTSFSLGIANTAHLSGALIGYILGKMNFFSWRHIS